MPRVLPALFGDRVPGRGRFIAGIRVRAALTLALVSSLGCVLLIDLPEGPLDHCSIPAEPRTCGACLRSMCSRPVDACCGRGSCRPQVGLVDTCAASGSCLAIGASADLREVADCARGFCAASCDFAAAPVDARPEPGTTYCQASANACTCAVAMPTNAISCGSAIARRACCADKTWPAADAQCECRSVSCHSESGRCVCDRFGTTSVSSTECEGSVCCANANACTCYSGPTTCPSASDRVVAKCDASTFVCDARYKRVDVCVQ